MLPWTNPHEHAPFPTNPLVHRTTVSRSSTGPSNSMNYEAVRTATSVLCEEMLRQRKSLDAREAEEVRLRMRGLGRLELVWRGNDVPMNGSVISLGTSGTEMGAGTSMVGEERVQRLFAKALRDGYVLCQLLNKFRPGSISQIDPREDGILRRSNVMKFLASCSANGLPQEDIFLPNDLVEGTSHSLARVARTAIALVKWAEVSTPTYPHSSTDGGNINPENLPPFRPLRLPPKRPRVIIDSGGPTLEPHLAGSAHAATRESPPRRPPRSPRRPPPNSLPETAGAGDPPHMPSAGGAIANSRRDQPISSSGKSRTTSSSTKNQATKESSTTNQSMAPSTKSPPPSTMEIYPSIMNRSPTNQSLSNQSRVSLGSVHSHRTNDQSKISLRGISSHETNNQSRVSLGSMLSQWKNDQPMVSAGNILSHWTNNQPSIPSPGTILSRSRRTSFTAPPRKGVTRSAKDISPPRKTLSIPPSSDSIAPPGIKRSLSQQQNGAARRPIVNLDIVNGFVPESAHPPRMTWWYRVRQIFARLLGQPRHQGPLHSNLGHLRTRRHVFVDAAVNKSFSCRVCVKPMKKKKGAVLCSRCYLVAHSKCVARVPPGCGL